ncbi:hypothetical protein DFJ74DRAFT_769959, partial [Hyaloraphidium curvatum]
QTRCCGPRRRERRSGTVGRIDRPRGALFPAPLGAPPLRNLRRTVGIGSRPRAVRRPGGRAAVRAPRGQVGRPDRRPGGPVRRGSRGQGRGGVRCGAVLRPGVAEEGSLRGRLQRHRVGPRRSQPRAASRGAVRQGRAGNGAAEQLPRDGQQAGGAAQGRGDDRRGRERRGGG